MAPMRRRAPGLALLALVVLSSACKGGGKLGASSKDGLSASGSAGGDASEPMTRGSHADPKGSGDPRCNSTVAQRSAQELDTNGNGILNLRKVYLVRGTGSSTNSTLICREADVNNDGVKDIVRLYDDSGKSLREDLDRNFDGKMDLAIIFQNGVVVTKEFDDNYDGTIDGKTFFDDGKVIRTELDLQGHSTPGNWRPTQWQYYEGGEVVRMGTDMDGDAKIDRWDRDQTKDEKVAEGGGAADDEGESENKDDAEGEDDDAKAKSKEAEG